MVKRRTGSGELVLRIHDRKSKVSDEPWNQQQRVLSCRSPEQLPDRMTWPHDSRNGLHSYRFLEGAMFRMLFPIAASLFACTPSPKETAMPSSSRDAETMAGSAGGSADPARAAVAPIPEPISAARNPLPTSPDSPAEAQGRRTLSTAFVRIGPDGQLTVELRDGRALILRDVVMRPKDYCGMQVGGGAKAVRYCGGYADVAAARPGGSPSPGQPDLAAPNPAKPAHD